MPVRLFGMHKQLLSGLFTRPIGFGTSWLCAWMPACGTIFSLHMYTRHTGTGLLSQSVASKQHAMDKWTCNELIVLHYFHTYHRPPSSSRCNFVATIVAAAFRSLSLRPFFIWRSFFSLFSPKVTKNERYQHTITRETFSMLRRPPREWKKNIYILACDAVLSSHDANSLGAETLCERAIREQCFAIFSLLSLVKFVRKSNQKARDKT